MSEEQLIDDQSHYEISLTAGQAFVAFVLLLLSLAASFAFGLMIGRGQGEDRLIVKKEPAVINEGNVVAAKRNDGKIVELGVEDFKPKTDTTVTDTSRAGVPPAVPAPVPAPAVVVERRDAAPTAVETTARPVATAPVYAQLLSTGDQKTAEALAATLIDKGFTAAYVERAGAVFKVRVRFPSEAEARAA